MKPPLSRRKVRMLIDILRRSVATNMPVVVVNRTLDENWATCERLARTYRLTLDPALGQPGYTWALIHEYAHAACWDILERWRESREHPPEFWLTHGRCYDALLGRPDFLAFLPPPRTFHAAVHHHRVRRAHPPGAAGPPRPAVQLHRD